MSYKPGDEPDIEVESLDDEEIDEAAVAIEVQRILLLDEAKIVSLASMLLIGVGALFVVGWFVLAWRTQSDLSGGPTRFASGDEFSSSDPDVADRIIAMEQIGVLLLIALLTIGTGCGLHLFASRVMARR